MSAEGNGDLQTLIRVLVARPRRCLTLSNPVPWQNWMAAYLGYTLQMKTLFRGWPIMVNDTHTRRRRSLHCCPHCSHIKAIPRLHVCCLSCIASWLVLPRSVLTASDCHQSRLQSNTVTCWHSDQPARLPKWCSNYRYYVCTRVAAVYLALVLRPTLGDRNNCVWSHLYVVCRWRCLLWCHNYHVLPSVCSSSTCCRSPSAWPVHLTHI